MVVGPDVVDVDEVVVVVAVAVVAATVVAVDDLWYRYCLVIF